MTRLRFGVFDFHCETGELRREGVPLHLQAQPAQVLAALLERPGEVVTRECLRQAVWGEGTFVDFDRGLNFCIAQIRSALGDSAESPRYIKTLPKRGYQFIAPVHGLPVAVMQEEPVVAATPAPALKSRRWILAPIVAVAALASGVWVWGRRGARLPVMAVGRFDNETGNPDFDRFAQGVTDTLVSELTSTGAGRYAVIGNAAMLLQPRRFRDVKMIGQELHANYVVIGQVQRNSTTVRVLAHLIRLPEQTHITVARLDCDAGDPLRAQLDLARQIAGRFNEVMSASPLRASR